MNRYANALTLSMVFLLTAGSFAACSSSSNGPSSSDLDASFVPPDSTTGDDGSTAPTTLATCLTGVASGPAPAACTPFVQCLEAHCGTNLSACFGAGYATGTITGECDGFEMCAAQSGCSTAAGVSCAGQTSSACQQCVQGLVSCAASSCLAQFDACPTGLLNGLYDGGTGSSSGGSSSGSGSSSGDGAAIEGGSDGAPGDAFVPPSESGPPEGGPADSGPTSFGAAVDVSVGTNVACALTASGDVVCWGYDLQGDLQGGTANITPIPQKVTGLPAGVRSVSVGESSACAVTAAGGVLCWGAGTDGVLGNDATSDSATPVQVIGLTSGVTAVSVGDGFACALTTGSSDGGDAGGGGVVCWGYNYWGQLGSNPMTNSPVPVQVPGLESGVTAIAAGEDSACAITVGGGAVCWGFNAYGQLGNDAPDEYLPAPVQVTGVTGVTSITVGGDFACAVASGAVVCWGLDIPSLGADAAPMNTGLPFQITGLTSGVTSVTAGNDVTCAISGGGGLVCWGYNQYGQVGDDSPSDSWVPVQVTGLASNVKAASAGSESTCAVVGCAVQCWGLNQDGQLGNGTSGSNMNSSVPVPVSLLGASSCP
jgi:alpha-tubulin suppressor-like RCC1 family protein